MTKIKYKNSLCDYPCSKLKIGDIFRDDDGELWIKIEPTATEGWFCHEDPYTIYYRYDCICLHDGLFGIIDNDEKCDLVKELEYDI